jgi:hypothetical protein
MHGIIECSEGHTITYIHLKHNNKSEFNLLETTPCNVSPTTMVSVASLPTPVIVCDPDHGPHDVSDWASTLWAMLVPSSLMCPMVFVMLHASILGLHSEGGGSAAFFT